MEGMFKSLNIDYKQVILKDDVVCYLTNANKDKIILCVQINSVEYLRSITNFIPQNTRKIAEVLSYETDKEIVNNRIPISRFLWDLYLVGIHQINDDGDSFDPVEVSDLQRDRFVARKIIIEYKTEEELKERFKNTIFPHLELDISLGKIEKNNNDMLKDMIKDVEIDDKENITTQDIFNYLDKVSEFLGKGD
ncbi:hypothetical protein [Lysinibacillus xylanilyticus]|uniref:hypothetical protein n=1 Tax=Lysinibacillus xylanilyticus TaxID=582475 RepID=UPI003D97A3F6